MGLVIKTTTGATWGGLQVECFAIATFARYHYYHYYYYHHHFILTSKPVVLQYKMSKVFKPVSLYIKGYNSICTHDFNRAVDCLRLIPTVRMQSRRRDRP